MHSPSKAKSNLSTREEKDKAAADRCQSPGEEGSLGSLGNWMKAFDHRRRGTRQPKRNGHSHITRTTEDWTSWLENESRCRRSITRFQSQILITLLLFLSIITVCLVVCTQIKRNKEITRDWVRSKVRHSTNADDGVRQGKAAVALGGSPSGWLRFWAHFPFQTYLPCHWLLGWSVEQTTRNFITRLGLLGWLELLT